MSHVKNLSKQRLIVDLYQSLIFNFGFNRWSYRWVIVQWIIWEDGEGFRGPIDLFGNTTGLWVYVVFWVSIPNLKSFATEDDQNFMERKKIERGEW